MPHNDVSVECIYTTATHNVYYMIDGETEPYQTITDGHILLRRYEPVEPQISDDEALSIVTGTMTATEALEIITGGGDE